MQSNEHLREYIKELDTLDLKTIIVLARNEMIDRARLTKQEGLAPTSLNDWLEGYFDTQPQEQTNVKCLGLVPLFEHSYHLWPALRYYLSKELGAWITNQVTITHLDIDDEFNVISITGETCPYLCYRSCQVIEFKLNNYATHLYRAWKLYCGQTIMINGKDYQLPWANRTARPRKDKTPPKPSNQNFIDDIVSDL